MLFTVEKLQDEPIVMVTFSPPVGTFSETAETGRAVITQVASLIAGIEEPVYRINDFSQVNIHFDQLCMLTNEECQGRAGSLSDPQVRGVIVGFSRTIKIFREVLSLHCPFIDVLAFTSLDEALEHVRCQLAADTGMRIATTP
jgi:hypothetical protein